MPFGRAVVVEDYASNDWVLVVLGALSVYPSMCDVIIFADVAEDAWLVISRSDIDQLS